MSSSTSTSPYQAMTASLVQRTASMALAKDGTRLVQEVHLVADLATLHDELAGVEELGPELRGELLHEVRIVQRGEERHRRELGLGFGRIVISETEAPNLLVNLVQSA